ncbi:MAG: divergent PAP2 family protein [Candidatus Dormibacteraeota bacterium]|nr:divergent PAP2 family protein [Candidatus Dormibacteraeota bacterium]
MQRYLLPAAVAWLIAQGLKLGLYSARRRRLDLRILAEMGGMPSSHSALVMALTAALGRVNGVNSSVFAVALVLSIVVMYDAQGVRRAAGLQASVLNRLVDDLMAQRGIREDRLRELVGHTPVQVLVGAALGIGIGLLPF